MMYRKNRQGKLGRLCLRQRDRIFHTNALVNPMIIVAVTGPVGSGKTSLLSQLVQWATNNEKRVDGFLALPIDRCLPRAICGVEASRGANRYDLLWVESGEQRPYARRNDAIHPPYEFDADTSAVVEAWTNTLAAGPRRYALVLDEFGPMEAAGAGHARYWDRISTANADVLILAVRDTALAQIQARLNMHVDVVIDATSKAALQDLKSVCLHHADWTIAGVFGAAAGGFEAFIGSALHVAQIPFRGQFLSTVQSVMMMYAGERMQQKSRVVAVSLISAGLKAFSPAGSRFRPMLAISTQGIFFGGAVAFLGWNALGILIAGWLVGAWAAALGVLLQLIVVGDDLFFAYDSALRWVALRLNLGGVTAATLFLLWVAFWGIVSASVTLVLWMRRRRTSDYFVDLIRGHAQRARFTEQSTSKPRALRDGFLDILRPHFWIPILIVIAILFASGSNWEHILWIALRAATVGWILFALARMIDPRAIAAWLRRKGHWGPALAFRKALHERKE
jgi:nucleoside-triphosphatase THEP1